MKWKKILNFNYLFFNFIYIKIALQLSRQNIAIIHNAYATAYGKLNIFLEHKKRKFNKTNLSSDSNHTYFLLSWILNGLFSIFSLRILNFLGMRFCTKNKTNCVDSTILYLSSNQNGSDKKQFFDTSEVAALINMKYNYKHYLKFSIVIFKILEKFNSFTTDCCFLYFPCFTDLIHIVVTKRILTVLQTF